MTQPRWRLVIAGVAALLILTEAAVRKAGLVDFPLYVRSDQFGYAPRPNQSGAFLGNNRWAFNDRGMPIEHRWQPGERTDVVLIGNSIVMGGNPYDQRQKVAPLLQALLGDGCTVWPVAAGGWTTVNEMRFLESNPDIVAAADFFIWEYMPGQMTAPNRWLHEMTHPTESPLWATGYVVRKVLAARFSSTRPQHSPSPADIAKNYQDFDRLLGRLAKGSRAAPSGLIFLYPDREQLIQARRGQEWVANRSLLQELSAAHGLQMIDIARFPQWTETLYKDPVHPTAQGNEVLASILQEAVHASSAKLSCDHAP